MDEEYLLIGFFIVVALMAAIKGKNTSESSNIKEKKQSSLVELEEIKKKQALEDEMDAYALEEHEKELVRKGEYNVWDFDTEEPLEDDDYYNDDV